MPRATMSSPDSLRRSASGIMSLESMPSGRVSCGFASSSAFDADWCAWITSRGRRMPAAVVRGSSWRSPVYRIDIHAQMADELERFLRDKVLP